MSAPFGNDPGKVERYRAFWTRSEAARPLVGFTLRGWLPLNEYAASLAWPTGGYLTPEMVRPAEWLADEERLLAEGELLGDDIIRGDMPAAAAIPWLSGVLGSRLRLLPGSILAEDRHEGWEVLDGLHLDRQSPWYRSYVDFALALVQLSAGRFPVSHGALFGPSDIHAELRGHTQSVLDLVEEPEQAGRALWRAAGLFQEITQDLWRQLPLWEGGYFDGMYQLWPPGAIARLQEDASGLYSPALYRQFLQPVDAYLAASFRYSFIHLHSTSMFLLDAFLEIEPLRCLEINYETSGPPLPRMISHFQRVQRAGRSLLVRGSFTPEEARLLRDSLDPRGLYLLILVRDLAEAERLRPPLGL